MLLTLVSAKGSPGVTTTATALAAVGAADRSLVGAAQAVDLVELDPSGGDIEPLTGKTGEPGLLLAATDLSAETLAEHAVEAPPGVRSVLAPTSGFEAASTIGAGMDAWAEALRQLGGDVVIDGGRWDPNEALTERVTGADVLVVLCRPDARGIEHARHLVGRADGLVPVVSLMTVGDRPYPPEEVAGLLDVPVIGAVAWDPGGAAALWAEGVSPGSRRFRTWTRSWLARSARAALAGVLAAGQGVPIP